MIGDDVKLPVERERRRRSSCLGSGGRGWGCVDADGRKKAEQDQADDKGERPITWPRPSSNQDCFERKISRELLADSNGELVFLGR